jgi:hypothetical protein
VEEERRRLGGGDRTGEAAAYPGPDSERRLRSGEREDGGGRRLREREDGGGGVVLGRVRFRPGWELERE